MCTSVYMCDVPIVAYRYKSCVLHLDCLTHSVDAVSNLHPEAFMSKIHEQLEDKLQATKL